MSKSICSNFRRTNGMQLCATQLHTILKKKDSPHASLGLSFFFNMVGREGFEPSKAEPTDLQSVVFDRFTISPKHGAGGGNQTPDILITSEMLYQLSYAGIFSNIKIRFCIIPYFKPLSNKINP